MNKQLNATPAVFCNGGKQNVTRLQRILDSSVDIICFLDKQGHFIKVNKAVITLLGYCPEELIGKDYAELCFEDDKQKTAGIIDKITSGIAVFSFENTLKHKDGKPVPVDWLVTWNAYDETASCIGRDISEKKKMLQKEVAYEQQLQQSHTLLTSILERVTDGFYAIDDQDVITYWNKQAEVVLQRKKEEVLGKNLWHCFPEAKKTAFYWYCHKTKSEQSSFQFEILYQPLATWFAVTTHPSNNGLFFFFRNINEEKRVESELEKFSIIAEQTANPVLITDAEVRITWVNRAFERTYGYTLQEVTGKHPNDFLTGPETDKATIKYIVECLKEKKPFDTELIYYTKWNEKLWMEIQLHPIYDKEGEINFFFSIQTNLTERNKLRQQLLQEVENKQEQINSAIIEAQEKDRALIGRELHDNVNQILTTVKLYNELCLSEEVLCKDLLKKSITYLNISIGEIRDISKMLATPAPTTAYLEDSLKDLVESVAFPPKLIINYSAYHLEKKYFNPDIHIALYRIIQEQLTNVIKHSQASAVDITISSQKNELRLFMQDNGIGFDVKKTRKGMGINNMISRAEVLNGSINLESSPGKGCLLYVTLPLLHIEKM